ncbi:SUMF1/EgtB/PvdO family nonheme iron enzyme [bacterium]|nr:SUMF1/EgtB/PvdO family nonheme iron enzyme [bacterium]
MRNTLALLTVTFLILFAVGCDHENDNPTITPENKAPEIITTGSGFYIIQPGAMTTLTCRAVDDDGDSLIYRWTADAGHFPDGAQSKSTRWTAPNNIGDYEITVTVSDGELKDENSVQVVVSSDGSFGEVDFAIGFDDLSMAMVWISPDCFMMGTLDTNTVKEWGEEQAVEEGIDPDSIDVYVEKYLSDYMAENYIDLDAKNDEFPRHNVALQNGFWIGKYEVTQELWEAVTDTNPSMFTGLHNPVDNVSWIDISVFIDTLNSRNPEVGWRLPSESEWEYACRAGNDSMRYPWGNDSTYSRVEYYAISGHYNGVGSHAEVGSRLANDWGIHDMLGNVWEWVEDKRHDHYRGAPDDGSAWLSGDARYRMMRGGSWYDSPQQCRSTQRNSGATGLRYQTVGFRLVRSGPAPIY